MAPARYFGVVFDRPTGKINQIYNPDHDFQLDLAEARLGPNEFMLKMNKDEFGISRERNGMTLDQVYALQERFNP